MRDEFGYIKICMNVLLAVTVIAAVVAYMTHPDTKEEIAEAVEEQKRLKAEERFYIPDVNTGEGWITVDRETGVCYYFQKFMNAGGMTVLVDADGKPVIWEGTHEDEE